MIRYWGFENQPATVARLESLLQRPPAPPSTSTGDGKAPAAPVVPWDEQIPKLVQRGDLAGALEAAWNDIEENGPARIRFYLAVVQRIAARVPGPSTEVAAAIDRLVGAYSAKLDESDTLRLAHIRMRHLGEKSDRFGTANRKFASRWNDATAQLMLARRMLATGQAFNHVSRLCKEARALYQAMPEHGGKAGHYATAYLELLDGIAHVGAVSLYKNDSFYNDAFEHFGRALELASRCRQTTRSFRLACAGSAGWASSQSLRQVHRCRCWRRESRRCLEHTGSSCHRSPPRACPRFPGTMNFSSFPFEPFQWRTPWEPFSSS